MSKVISVSDAEHYIWGDNCDGWHLLKRDDVSIIQERVPPGKSEVKHYHKYSRQFFYVLDGEAEMVLDDTIILLHKGEGIEISPGTSHQLKNNSIEELKFLVVSVPKSHGDKIIV